MLELWKSLLLGLIQGITEWLPVSSSGHLVLSQELLGVEVPVAYDLLLHVATLGAVVTVYWRRLWAMTAALATYRGGSFLENTDRKLILLLVIGTLPIAFFGLFFEDQIEAAFDSTMVVGFALLATGLWLLSTHRATTGRPLTFLGAFLVGLAQAAALLPGISRSGATLGATFHLGLDRKDATDLAFLLSVPALLGATILKGGDIAGLGSLGWTSVLAGAVTAYVVGTVTLTWLVGFVRRVGLTPFAFYCVGMGGVVVGVGYI